MTMRNAREIVEYECIKAGISVRELQQSGRTKTISAIRQHIITRLRDETPLSWSEIGRLVGLGAKPNKQYARAK